MAQNLSNLPIGAKIKFGRHSINGETAQDIIWRIVDKNHSGYPNNSVTLMTDRIIDLRCFDDAEPLNTNGNSYRYGNNRYSVSNINSWLNSWSSAGEWYGAMHDTDAPPANTSQNINRSTGYYERPGFLNSFTLAERNAILSTEIKTLKPQPENSIITYDTISCRVFVPSTTEVGLEDEVAYPEGAVLGAFSGKTNDDRISYPTQQVVTYSLSGNKPTLNQKWDWMLRTPNVMSEYSLRNVNTSGALGTSTAAEGSTGVRPVLNIPSTTSISDTTDSDGCYTPIFNSAPPVPTTLNVPTIYGGKAVAISWSKVTDPDNDAVTYQLESSVNGGAFSTIYSGGNLAFTTTIPSGSTSVQFRVKAMDSQGASSGYITSTRRTVINNSAPSISGSNGSLGTKSSGFTQTYTITDGDSNPVTVTEAINGVQIRSYVATLGATNTFSVTGNTWAALSNGTHTMTITATDGIDSVVRTYTFTKSVSSLSIVTSPMAASARPTRIKVSVVKTIPAEATFKIEVCNNGYDSSPVWEDATSSMNNSLIYLFSNTTKTSTNWGVRIRVTVNRNGGSGACYVTSIGGNFE